MTSTISARLSAGAPTALSERMLLEANLVLTATIEQAEAMKPPLISALLRKATTYERRVEP